jgi:hypothetical protein
VSFSCFRLINIATAFLLYHCVGAYLFETSIFVLLHGLLCLGFSSALFGATYCGQKRERREKKNEIYSTPRIGFIKRVKKKEKREKNQKQKSEKRSFTSFRGRSIYLIVCTSRLSNLVPVYIEHC